MASCVPTFHLTVFFYSFTRAAGSRVQRVGPQHGADGGDVDPLATAGLPGAEGRPPHLRLQVAGQADRRDAALVERELGQRVKTHLRPEGQQAKPRSLPLHRPPGHHQKKEVSGYS